MVPTAQHRPYKLPESVLVVIHTPALEVLLIRRTGGDGHWQSVTGSKDRLDESFEETAARSAGRAPTSAYTKRGSSKQASALEAEKQRSAARCHGNHSKASCSRGLSTTGVAAGTHKPNTRSRLRTTPGAYRCSHCGQMS